MTTSLDSIAELLGTALAPLTEVGSGTEVVVGSLEALGFAPPPGLDAGPLMTLDARAVVEKLALIVRSTPAELQDAQLMAGRYAALAVAVAVLVEAIAQLATDLPTLLAAAGDYVSASRIAEQLPRRLTDWLLINAVADFSPQTAAVLRTLGIFGSDPYPADASIYQLEHQRSVIRYERLTDLVTDPAGLFVAEYAWGTPRFDAHALLTNLALLLQSLGLRPRIRFMPAAVESALTEQVVAPDDPDPGPQLLMPITALGDVLPVDMALSIHRLRPTRAGGADGGLELSALLSGAATFVFDLTSELSLQADASLDLGAGVGIALRPTGASLRAGFLDGATPGAAAAGSFGLGLHRKRADGKAARVLAAPGGSLIEVMDVFFEVGAEVVAGTAPEPFVRAALTGGHIAVTLAGADSFLGKVLPAAGIDTRFDLDVRWSRSQGLRFKGAGALEIEIPVHETIGPFDIETITIGIGAPAGRLTASVAVSGGLTLGPMRATVDKLGVLAQMALVRGNLGNADLAIRFRAPSGIGLAIDGSALSGGGYLSHDEEKGQYAGILHLSVRNAFDIKVIGILDTRMRDGRQGYSLLLIVSVEFAPIQLGYGFTLNGVGGLAAFNRTMLVDVLRKGVRNGMLDSIMFPPDPVANSSKIISDLESVFPPSEGRFVFAPMVKIGWGSSILVIEIGLAVELPSPLRLALMGKVHLLLPPAGADKSGDERVPIELHMAVLGTLDFDEGEIYVTASLYNSFIAIFPVTGGMVTRIRWGRDPVFLLSVGGFNPRFTPPPGMDPVDRVGIQLSYDKEGVRAALRLESYFALTANSFQMGARLDAYAEVVKIATLRGYLGFDALIESPPFHFVVDLFGGVEVRAFGFGFACDLLLTLRGPGPVEGNGYVKIEFLGEHRVDVHFLIGEPAPEPPLPLVDPYEELILALKDRRNWTATPPDNARMFVTLRQVTASEVGLGNAEADAPPPLLVHPLGELSVRQRVLPFGLRLERFGGARPSSLGPFAIASFDVAGDTVSPGADDELRDAFARGQFSRLTDDQKLTLPAFEPMICGYRHVVNDEVAFGAHQDTDFDLDVIVIDDKAQPPAQTIRIALLDAALARGTQCGAARIMSPPPPIGGKFAGPTAGISVTGPRYAVASKDTLQASAARYSTHVEAEADEELRGPSMRRFQVVEEYEIA